MTTYVGDVAGLIEVRDELANPDHTAHVLHEVFCEREAQDRKWGQQNHPNGTGPGKSVMHELGFTYFSNFDSPLNDDLRDTARVVCDDMHKAGRGTFEQILTEEWTEAIAESDPTALRKELIQVAAVAVAWVEKLDREALVGGGV